MSQKKASSETPEIDYIVQGVEAVGGTALKFLAAVVTGVATVLCCAVVAVVQPESQDRKP